MSRAPIEYFVLDALANDLEDVDHIVQILNSPTEFGWRDQHPEPFTPQEVIPPVLKGIREGNIEACIFSEEERALVGAGEGVIPSSPLSEVWFRLTPRGRLVLNNWDPPPLPTDRTL